jgi:N-acetylglucosaminyldiphosphoundecaprenol N-acetyl-beta-D-mannosaminyltransferase
MNAVNILGIKVNEVNEKQALELVANWLSGNQKKYIVTPNIEFIMVSQKDAEFKKVINNADLAIPDSGRFNWALTELESNGLKKILFWPLFFFPKSPLLKKFPVTAGTDLMESLIKNAAENNWSIGLLGGKEIIAETLKHKLQKKYPDLQITYANPGGVIDRNGIEIWENGEVSEQDKIKIPKTDILFVAFGHGKQEKWIAKNIDKQPVKVMMGVGGAFDYLSGSIPRAPKVWQQYGFEWLYRLIQQPWRAKRFLSLIQFTMLILNSKK